MCYRMASMVFTVRLFQGEFVPICSLLSFLFMFQTGRDICTTSLHIHPIMTCPFQELVDKMGLWV